MSVDTRHYCLFKWLWELIPHSILHAYFMFFSETYSMLNPCCFSAIDCVVFKHNEKYVPVFPGVYHLSLYFHILSQVLKMSFKFCFIFSVSSLYAAISHPHWPWCCRLKFPILILANIYLTSQKYCLLMIVDYTNVSKFSVALFLIFKKTNCKCLKMQFFLILHV